MPTSSWRAGGTSVLFDVIVLALSKEGPAMLSKESAAVASVLDAFAHLKVIRHTGEAQPLLDKAGVVADAGVLAIDGHGAKASLSTATKGRVGAASRLSERSSDSVSILTNLKAVDWVRPGANMKTMNDLFLHFLQDIYYAEKAFAKSSAKIMKAVQNEEVREILKKAKDQAKEPIDALDRVFEAVDKRPRGKTCEAMNGLLAECQEAIEEGESGPVLDAALIACLQGIKTYEVTRYGSLLAFARQMGLETAVEELEKLRDAAHKDDEALSKIAEGDINMAASKETGKDDEGKEPDEDEEPGEDDEKGKPKTVKKPISKR